MPSQVPQAVELVRRRIPAVSLDLIFGVPGQTEQESRRPGHRAVPNRTISRPTA